MIMKSPKLATIVVAALLMISCAQIQQPFKAVLENDYKPWQASVSMD